MGDTAEDRGRGGAEASGCLRFQGDSVCDRVGDTPEHEVGDPVDDAVIVPAVCRLILVEGIYTLLREGEWAGLKGLFDETWFLVTPVETAMSRIHRRHMEARQRADSNDRLNCAHITPGRENADYLVNG